MIIVDSDSRSDYFNGVSSPHAERLDLALREVEDLAVLPIIITEVLQGFRTDAGFRQAQTVLVALRGIHPRFGIVNTH